MAANIYDWVTTALSNGTADTGINFAEGQLPATVNDSARTLMARVAEFRSDLGSVNAAGAVNSTGGAANAYTLTVQSGFTAFKAGLIVAGTVHAANSGASTINVNSTGVKNILNRDGAALTSGQLAVGTLLVLVSDATAWRAIDIGTAVAPLPTAGAAGSLLYSNPSPAWTGSADLFWDQANKRIGFGTATPSAKVTVSGAGQSTFSYDTTSNAAALLVDDVVGAPGNGGAVVFSANSQAWKFAAIKGYAIDGTSNSLGLLSFSTRTVSSDSTLTEKFRLTSSGIVTPTLLNGFLKTDGSGNVSAAALSTAPDVIVEEQQTSGTNSTGSYGSGAFATLTLNTLKRNVGSIASLASSQVTLGAGTYYISMNAIANPDVAGAKKSKIKLRNITDSTDAIIGTGHAGNFAADNLQRLHTGSDVVVIAASKTFAVQGWSTAASTTTAGLATSSGITEVYTRLEIWKIA